MNEVAPRPSANRSTFVAAAVSSMTGLLLAVVGSAIFAATSASRTPGRYLDVARVESRAALWTASSLLVLAGLALLVAGTLVVLKVFRRGMRQWFWPLLLAWLGVSFVVASQLQGSSWSAWVSRAQDGLGFMGGAGFVVEYYDATSVLETILGGAFMAGALAGVVGIVWLVVRVIITASRRVPTQV